MVAEVVGVIVEVVGKVAEVVGEITNVVGEIAEVVGEVANVVGEIAEVPDAGAVSSSAWRQHGVIRAKLRLTGGSSVLVTAMWARSTVIVDWSKVNLFGSRLGLGGPGQGWMGHGRRLHLRSRSGPRPASWSSDRKGKDRASMCQSMTRGGCRQRALFGAYA